MPNHPSDQNAGILPVHNLYFPCPFPSLYPCLLGLMKTSRSRSPISVLLKNWPLSSTSNHCSNLRASLREMVPKVDTNPLRTSTLLIGIDLTRFLSSRQHNALRLEYLLSPIVWSRLMIMQCAQTGLVFDIGNRTTLIRSTSVTGYRETMERT